MKYVFAIGWIINAIGWVMIYLLQDITAHHLTTNMWVCLGFYHVLDRFNSSMRCE